MNKINNQAETFIILLGGFAVRNLNIILDTCVARSISSSQYTDVLLFSIKTI